VRRLVEKSYDRIKNFSTEIPVSRTIAEIEKMLTKYGATHIMKEYDGEMPVKLLFAIETAHGKLSVRLPVYPDRVLAVFKIQVEKGLLPPKYWSWKGEWALQQAHRVAWRIVKDWLDAELTMLNVDAEKLEEIFLAHIYNDKLHMTVYEMLEKNKFNFDLLEEHQ